MLNMLSDIEATAEVRGGFLAGACLPADVVISTASGHTGPSLLGRPRAARAGAVFGGAVGIRPDQALAQPGASNHYAQTTRIAALSGGTQGPHPARDPV